MMQLHYILIAELFLATVLVILFSIPAGTSVTVADKILEFILKIEVNIKAEA